MIKKAYNTLYWIISYCIAKFKLRMAAVTWNFISYIHRGKYTHKKQKLYNDSSYKDNTWPGLTYLALHSSTYINVHNTFIPPYLQSFGVPTCKFASNS
jgi:hypothetical protein